LSPDISTDEIPQALLEEVRLEIQHYLVPLLVASLENPEHPLGLGGSGTLVELAGRHYILTADHVWDNAERWHQIGLMLAEGTPLGIPCNLVRPKRLGLKPYSQWGPDLALLEIPPHLVRTIAARKSFLNLGRRRPMLATHPPRLEKTVWAVMGLVGQKSKVELSAERETVIATVRAEALFAWTCAAARRDEYDYLTLHARTTLPDVPSSFKGISGGGLWEIVLRMRGEKIISLGEHHFRGVAFWQTAEPPDRVAIRCHGPYSIFHTAWAKWSLQE
jgi:hypothetical protein